MRGNLMKSAEGFYGDSKIKITVSHITNDPLTYDFFVHDRIAADGAYTEVGFLTIEPDSESLIHPNMDSDAAIEALMPVVAERVLNPDAVFFRFVAENLVEVLRHSGATAYFYRPPNGEYAYTFQLPEKTLKTVRIPHRMLYEGAIREEHMGDVIGFLKELGLSPSDAKLALACASDPTILKQWEERQTKFRPLGAQAQSGSV